MSTSTVPEILHAFRAAPFGIVLLDADDRVTASNAEARRLLADHAEDGAHLPAAVFDALPAVRVLASRPVEPSHPADGATGSAPRRAVYLESTAPGRQPADAGVEYLRAMQLHEQALNAMSEGVAILSAAGGEYLYMNVAHARMYGYEPNDLLGRSWMTLYEESEQRGFALTAFPALERDQRWSGEVRGRLKDGSHSLFSVSLALTGDYLVCCCQDVSEHKKQAAQLREVAQHLDDANAELRTAAALKDEFLATVSHELRSPLHAILGAIELVDERRSKAWPADVHDHLRTVSRSARHLHDLINDLLDVSSIVSRGIELAFSDVPAGRILSSAIMLLSERADEKKVSLISRVEPPNAVITVDERRLLQVVVNLVSNAIDFTPAQGHVRVTARVSVDTTEIQVEDSGCGIPEDQHEAIFQKFHQVDRSLGRRHDGTGLGLFLVRELVRLHGGSVTVASVVGEGSTFTVTLPTARHVAP